ncbi:MAG: DUF924 domain-containing protein [Betaproteobacteria bacterium]|nr:DUF924 domain-containing protein [Betaproteobacteria bacterium]
MNSSDVIDFWFEQTDPKLWWKNDPGFDALIRQRFKAVHYAASRGELFGWRTTAEGRLAEIIVLDQFSRNMFRGTAQAFAFDALALALAQEAVAQGLMDVLRGSRVAFLIMPYMHSESLSIHEQAVKLFARPGLEGSLAYELKHKAVIERFGRYPHRNAIIGRISTPEEIDFLKQPGSSF